MASDTLGARVDRLEASTAELGRQVERVAGEQAHLDKMMTMRFTTVDTALAGIALRIETMNTSIVTAGSDPAQTPGGRMYMALGAVSLTVVLLGLFGPAIRAAIGLP